MESAKSKTALSEGVERPPQQPVEERHQNAHDGDPENHAREIAGFGRSGNIGTDTVSRQMGVAPTRHFRDDGGVPRSARRGDGARDVIREDAGQDDFYPPSPSPEMKAAGGLAQIGRKGAGARDDVEQDVPLPSQDHQRAEPDIRVQPVPHDGYD